MNDRYSPSATVGCAVWRLLGLLVLLVIAVPAGARPIVEINAAERSTTTDFGWYDVLADPQRRFSLADVSRGAAAADFHVASPRNVNFGFSTAVVWARFTLRFAPDRQRPLYLVLPKPLLDEVELFALRADGRSSRMLTGDAHAFSSRQRDYRGFAFELSAAPGQTVDYYLRVHSPVSAIGVPLRLMSEGAFSVVIHRENFLLGGYFGVMVGLALASILIFATFRHRIFFYYFAYLAAFTITLLAVSGYGQQLLWPQASSLQQTVPTVLVALTMLLGVIFVREFLSLSSRWRAMDRVLLAVCAIGLGGAAAHVLFDPQLGTMIVIAGAVALCSLAFFAFARCVLAGDRNARYFLFGWLACVIGVIAAALDMYGLIPTTPLSAYGLYVGSLAEFAALAVALGGRLRMLQSEKEDQIASTNAELAALNLNLENMVQRRTRELEKRNRELGELAIRDSLTGLYNHSTTIELLDQILSQSQRYKFAVTVVMVDLDHFKRVNDRYGHQVGDEVLEIVSQTLVDSVRDSDVVGRFGGEEFLIAMPHADVVAAREFGERLLCEVREIAVPHALGEHLSISVGVSVYSPLGPRLGAAELIRRADQALYRSKRAGRDCLTVDSMSVVAAAGVGAPHEPA